VPSLGCTGVQGDAVPSPLGGQVTSQPTVTRAQFVLAHSVTRECFVHGMHLDAPQQMKVGFGSAPVRS
jgi:hypothetical protein